VQRHDFAFDLPADLIAQTPLAERSASRMLVLDGPTGAARDRSIRDLPGLLQPGDLLVLNDTKVVAARLLGTKPSGGKVEIFLERAISPREALVQLRASKPIREGLEVSTPGGAVSIVGREDDLWRAAFPGAVLDFFEKWGEVPLPPYIRRTPGSSDRERYQTIFARERGAVAAPTASLHFDAALMEEIEARGVRCAFVTLHVGAGTFQPVRVDDLDAHTMHAERVSVSAATWEAVGQTRAAGGRVVAVGTTVVRALESAALAAAALESGRLQSGGPAASTRESGVLDQAASVASESAPRESGAAASTRDSVVLDSVVVADPAASTHKSIVVDPGASAGWSGETRLFIRPGFRFQIVDALLTNFHLSESTLLMLVCAFAGRESVLAAYQHAVQARYRFFSYGDAMLVTPAGPRS
jgi:S-adenosylmethionine:tRNA ribosyltransferase-isomerase